VRVAVLVGGGRAHGEPARRAGRGADLGIGTRAGVEEGRGGRADGRGDRGAGRHAAALRVRALVRRWRDHPPARHGHPGLVERRQRGRLAADLAPVDRIARTTDPGCGRRRVGRAGVG
jgi:hypothetical protein